MCLVAVAWEVSERYPLVLAANRDESHLRPTQSAGWWEEDLPYVFGGRDLVAGGSWLAASTRGRIAAVTNVHEPPRREFPRSRGALVKDYLAGEESTEAFLAALGPEEHLYGPFNLLLFDGSLSYASNRERGAQLPYGIHAFSNAVNGTSWPKVARAKVGMARALDATDPVGALFSLLAERTQPEGALRDTRAHLRSTLFVSNEAYGTRSSTLLLLERHGELTFIERQFDQRAELVGETTQVLSLGSRDTRAGAR
jgi:uncharacterized protein with NRDE domain